MFETGGKTYPLPDVAPGVNPVNVSYIVFEKFVSAYASFELAAWDLAEGKLVSRGAWTMPKTMSMVMFADNILFVAGGAGYRRADGIGTPVAAEIATFLTSRTGMVLGMADGTLWIRDHNGLLKLGRRQSRFLRLDQSIDGRFVIASTQSG